MTATQRQSKKDPCWRHRLSMSCGFFLLAFVIDSSWAKTDSGVNRAHAGDDRACTRVLGRVGKYGRANRRKGIVGVERRMSEPEGKVRVAMTKVITTTARAEVGYFFTFSSVAVCCSVLG